MNKKEIEQIREDLELLKTNELIEIIIDQDKQIKTYEKESEDRCDNITDNAYEVYIETLNGPEIRDNGKNYK